VAALGHKEQAQLWERRYREEALSREQGQHTVRELEGKLDLARQASELLQGDAAAGKVVASLRQDLAAKNKQIAELSARIDAVRKECVY
jgi:hypothetical protein